ncbi:uncharacterized protein LOC124433853 isoform X2 [Xenia sp. Carnegie-2017]|uniref:uncharacterized protein LOC124433853 isoform X2 n=1 Tax=Xenia sp. Carnegie-2017 TaxID=2897299 RepID=UPI001F0370D1|nr:uncharacterized protein LOC124433853 isoform X2 [Xenia sp. Carnegie-2017]
MLKPMKSFLIRNVRQQLNARTVVGAIAVYCLLKSIQYSVDYYNNYDKHFVKVDNLDIIQADFHCTSSLSNDSCTIETEEALMMCFNMGSKCFGVTYNFGTKTATFKRGKNGKPKFSLGIVTTYKNEYKDLLMLKESDECAPVRERREEANTKTSNKICNIPNIDPFDSTVMKMVKKVEPLVCKGEKNLTFYRNGKLTLTAAGRLRAIKAEYEVIKGRSNSGEWFNVKEKGTLTPSKPEVILNEDMVYVEIHKTDNKIQKEFHMEVNSRDEILNRVPQKKPGIPLNIMMVGLDSTSHAHFQRKLDPIYKYLKNDLKSQIFNAQSIVGDGTTAALIAMLVGQHIDELPEGRRGKFSAKCLDRWPWIFKDMSAHGYATFYNEDEVFWGAITTRLKSFCKPPIDHYLLPLWYVALDRLSTKYQKMVGGMSYLKGHCLGSEAIYNISFNSIKSFFKAYPNQLKFGFQISSDFCHHEDFNFISLVEDDLLSFLKYFKTEGYLNNTILILFGDHGLRYGFVRSTVLGRMEERLPFLSVTLPEWFEKVYPKLYENIQRNRHVLTTPFDIHATFQHILMYPREPRELPHGKSLFTDIGWRTCEQAGIPFHFCPCVDWKDVEVDNEDVQKSASAVVDMINERLTKNSVEAKCARLNLKEVISAKLITSKGGEEETNRGQFTMSKILKGGCMYQLQLITSPNNGMYESTVQLISGIPNVNQQLSRINAYNDQSDCIRKTHPFLREVCFCHGATPSKT